MYGVHRNALLQAHAVNRIEHTITLLDHLSRRLENYMLQATVIIAFAVTSLSAETLEIMASYTSAFCVWKSPAVCLPLDLQPNTLTRFRLPMPRAPAVLTPWLGRRRLERCSCRAQHNAIGLLFVLSTSACVCLCIIVVVTSSQILHSSHEAALTVSAVASVAVCSRPFPV